MADADRLLSDLNDRQHEAVTTTASPLAILAGAGSGKTRVLTRRIAWLAAQGVVDARHVLAVTFTRKAAGELSHRLEGLGVRREVTSGTFHGLALAQLRRRWRDRGEAVPALLERKSRILAPLLGGGPSVGAEAAEVAGEIEWAKARLIVPDGYEDAVLAAGRPTPRPAAEIASLYGRYETEKARRGVVDFDDLLWRLADALEGDAEFAAVIRWRHRHLFVDEFQDVNPAQFRLIRLWLGDRRDLCVVGDDDQAVYGFTGADAGYLVHFGRHFPGASVVRLEENYRSTPQVLAAAHAVLPGGARRKKPLRPTLGDGPLPTITAYASDRDEAAAVARALQAAHQPGAPWAGTAVLYRTNAQSAPLEAALRAAGVPFRVRGAARFLDRPAVAAALDELRRASAAAPGLPLVAHLAGLGEWAEESGGGEEARRERRDHVDALVRLGHDYLAAETAYPAGTAGSQTAGSQTAGSQTAGTAAGFVAYLVTVLAEEDPTGSDAVELLTFHKAKGLEWPAVFVTGLERGLVPIAYAETPAALAEERRLLYVALTRAERQLHLSWAQRRTLGGREMSRQASPYLTSIEAALAAFGPGGDGDWQAAVAAERARLAQARAAAGRERTMVGASADPRVLAELVAWRKTLARASGVPAQVIFHDATLAAVAEARPVSRDALMAVPGLGPMKVERYGEELLALVARSSA
ncbi:MAG TPA: ATP-dependent DNA helicase UvrD2 [Acidimicrobiia bacterium]|nr:ATP-dependent DNA helicase UvrD2 [Acidimicrobiia bacterium]